ncbi:hypothetical protein [Breoghania sp.]|uniref:GHMP family kinase ATP-binding protein n=1 Tax=Breoghania sp. TaxID=2065378 RepID=UPI00262D0AB0|nr:hypothetical protein [Breoghania sp.]MDJ0933202.1 hypothetical protein [Breoghania sp.]
MATNRSFHKRYRFVYSRVEEVASLAEVEHPLIREIARDYPVPFIDFASFADVPAGMGLGTSSAFTAATSLNLAAYTDKSIDLRIWLTTAARSRLTALASLSASRISMRSASADTTLFTSIAMGL